MLPIVAVQEKYAASYRACLDVVAREKKYLAQIEALPLERIQGFVKESVATDAIQFFALDGDAVVGWADIFPGWAHAVSHGGSLGMGVHPNYRGQGLGRRLLVACIEKAWTKGLTRIELEARADNGRAIALYESLGFTHEGLKTSAVRFDGIYFDAVQMRLLNGEANQPMGSPQIRRGPREVPTIVLSTERLFLRSARQQDFETLYAHVFGDERVMQHLSGAPWTRERAAELFSEAFDHQGTGQKIGVLVERRTDAVVGYAGLKACDALGDEDFELGFVLQSGVWGRGYATEIGRAQLAYGFRTTDRCRLLAQVRPANSASAHALKKIGMSFVKECERPALGTWHVYCRQREA